VPELSIILLSVEYLVGERGLKTFFTGTTMIIVANVSADFRQTQHVRSQPIWLSASADLRR
jgi:hypothetical protein